MPLLGDDERVRVLGTGGLADGAQERRGQLVRDVEAPAVDASPDPVAHHPVLTRAMSLITSRDLAQCGDGVEAAQLS